MRERKCIKHLLHAHILGHEDGDVVLSQARLEWKVHRFCATATEFKVSK